jgi:hypothetical protein
MKHVYIIILAILFIACQNKTKETKSNSKYPITINFKDHFKNYQEVKLSEIADQIEYIKLENKTDCFVKYPGLVYVCDSCIFTAQYKSVLKFDRKGKFICQIGKLGKGPGEYANCMGLSIDEKEKLLYVNSGSSKKIIVYDWNGKYIRSLQHKNVWHFEMLDSTKVATIIINISGSEKSKLLISNTKGDTLNSLPNSEMFNKPKAKFTMLGNSGQGFYTFNSILHVTPQYDDTIFSVQSAQKIIPKYIIDKGEYKLPTKYRMERYTDYKAFQAKARKYIFTKTLETNRFLLLPYHNASEYKYDKIALYNKESQELFSVGNSNENTNGFTNDLDGYGHFVPSHIQNTKYFIDFTSAVNFLDKHDELIQQIKENNIPKNCTPQFIDFVKSVKEDDNLVLQIIHLKENI